MADFTIKRHDLQPSISSTLTHSDGSGGLSTATSVKFIMRAKWDSTATPVVSAAAVLVTIANTSLSVRYDWQAGDTLFVGDYYCEWEVTFSGGKIETFPNDSYNTVTILADLG